MEEIIEYMINLLGINSSVTTYLGSDSDDSRIYQYEIPDRINFSSTQKSALFYKVSQSPLPNKFTYPIQHGNINFHIQVLSIDKSDLIKLSEIIIEALAAVDAFGFETDNWKVGYVRMNGAYDGPNEGTPKLPLYVKNLSFSLEGVYEQIHTS